MFDAIQWQHTGKPSVYQTVLPSSIAIYCSSAGCSSLTWQAIRCWVKCSDVHDHNFWPKLESCGRHVYCYITPVLHHLKERPTCCLHTDSWCTYLLQNHLITCPNSALSLHTCQSVDIQLSVSGSNHSALAWVIVITQSVVIGVDSLSLCGMCWWGRQRSARNVKSRSKPKHVISARNCLQRRLTGCTCWPRRCIILSTVCHN